MNSSDCAIPAGLPTRDDSIASPAQAEFEQGAPKFQQTLAIALNSTRKIVLLLRSSCFPRMKQRRLRVTETVSLGEKRFVSIIEVDGQDFLLGGGTAGVSLLTRLEPTSDPRTFQQAAQEAWQKAGSA